MDTNRREDKYYGKENQTGYWEGIATSHGRRNTISCREQYYTENTDIAKRDRRIYRQRNEEEVTRAGKQRTDINREEQHPWGDHYRNDYNPYNQERYWHRDSAQYRG